ncbi:hypothetical protein ACWPKS_13320 [Coraliomargarita sp. W4R72]
MNAEDLKLILPQIVLVGGTLLGAIIAVSSSALNSRINHKKTQKAAKEERDRTRFEAMYLALIEIENSYNSRYFSVVKRIQSGKKFKIESTDGVPPIKKLKMLVDLYHPELKTAHDVFEQKKAEFGKKFTALLTKNPSTLSDLEKEEIFNEFTELWKGILGEIKKLQDAISNEIIA